MRIPASRSPPHCLRARACATTRLATARDLELRAATTPAGSTFARLRLELRLFARRLLAGCVAAVFVLSAYYGLGALTRERHHDLATAADALVPFWPETVWIYFPGYLLVFISGVLFIRDRVVFRRTLRAVGIAVLLCSAGFALLPSTMPLPPLDASQGLSERFLAWFRGIDVPNNTFPSQHVALAFAIALAAFAQSRRLGAWLTLTAALVSISTFTTKQHYVVDALGGFLVAWLSVWLARAFETYSAARRAAARPAQHARNPWGHS